MTTGATGATGPTGLERLRELRTLGLLEKAYDEVPALLAAEESGPKGTSAPRRPGGCSPVSTPMPCWPTIRGSPS